MKYFCKKCKSYTERANKKCCPVCGANLKDAAIAPETVIAGFKIVEEIGRGSNGVVYLAEQTSLDRQVALKILPDAKAEDPDFVKAFLKEARAAARLNHPNIIQAYDAGMTSDGVYFLAMELIDGRSLEWHLQSKGAMKTRNAIKIALQLAKALEYSWKKEHLFHGDIKPDNIMIRKDGHAKLADFGLAKTIFDEKSDEIMATPMYAPPEVIRAEHKKIGFKSDMYSFGVTLYEIISGKPPFDEADCQKVLKMHLRKAHAPLIERMPDIDKSLSDLIDKLLNKDPKQRPASWTSVVESLEEIRTEKAKSKRKLRLTAGIAASLVICGLAAAGIWYYYSENEKKPEPKPLTKPVTVPKPSPGPQVTSAAGKKSEPEKVETAKNDKIHAEVKELLKNTENLSGGILRISRLRFQALKLQNNEYLQDSERKQLAMRLAGMDSYIHNEQQLADKQELENLRLALQKEKSSLEKRRAAEHKQNLLLAEKNKILKIISKFLAYRREQQVVRTLQFMVDKVEKPDKKLPEYKALTFLLKILPHRYNREAIILENLDQLTGKKLPWKIKDREYSILRGGSWQNIHLQTRLSQGVFSRKKLRGTSISDAHWCLMVDEFLIKGNMKSSKKNFLYTACWLLLYAKGDLFEAFVRKYYPDDLSDWLNCRKFIVAAPLEVAAYDYWNNIVTQMAELNSMAYGSINKFQAKFATTEVYKKVQASLLDYQEIVYTIYPEGIVDRLKIASLSLASSDAKVFSAQNRYRLLNSIPSSIKISLRNLFNKKLHSLSGNKQFAGCFGIFDDVPCGKVYSWIVSSPENAKGSFMRKVPALLDIDGWTYIKHAFEKSGELKFESSQFQENTEQYLFSLYCTGLAALRYGKWDAVQKVFSAFRKFIPGNSSSGIAYALLADLSLKLRDDQYSWEVLNKYRSGKSSQADEIIISLLKLQTLLARKPLDEIAVAKAIAAAEKYFAPHSSLHGDLKALALLQQFICAGFKPDTGISAALFSQTAYPHLHACLWLEAAARDKVLQRNSIKIPSLLKACRSVLTSSAFRSDLFQKITLLNLGYRNLTPVRLCREVDKSLSELGPCAANSYPALLTLLFASELFDRKLPVGKLASFARNYAIRCPVFSIVERQFPNILYSSRPAKILQNCLKLNPPTFQMIYLWILAAAKEKRTGREKEYILKLKSFRQDLSWTEELLVERFVELIENS